MTHLSFANDVMVYFEATPYSLKGIKEVLEKFYYMYGIEISFSKSEIFWCGISTEEEVYLANLLGVRVGKLHVRYFSIPRVSGKLKSTDCKPLIDKITTMIQACSSKFLTYAGRMQLISSVLASMYNYWCTIFFLPNKVIKKVEKICCAILWKEREGPATRAKVSWDMVCRLKEEGGLGLKKLVD